jgi:hypothetical protein
MSAIVPHFWKTCLLSAVLLAPTAALRAQDRQDQKDHKDARTYHDKQHNDDHEWNSHEDQAYRIWAKENHRKYSDFAKLKDRDQQSYWAWRHDHSDAALKIEIR